MCILRPAAQATGILPKEYSNRPVTVSGVQIGVKDPKDTTKATESLKIQRAREEGTYIEPNLTTAKALKNPRPRSIVGLLANMHTIVRRA